MREIYRKDPHRLERGGRLRFAIILYVLQAAAESEHTVVRGMDKGANIFKEVMVNDTVFFDVEETQSETEEDGGEHFSDPPLGNDMEEDILPDKLELVRIGEVEGKLSLRQASKRC